MRGLVFQQDSVGARIRIYFQPGTVTYAYNLSYSGGGDQEDQGLRPAWTKS
jgi:hypothetical protein